MQNNAILETECHSFSRRIYLSKAIFMTTAATAFLMTITSGAFALEPFEYEDIPWGASNQEVRDMMAEYLTPEIHIIDSMTALGYKWMDYEAPFLASAFGREVQEDEKIDVYDSFRFLFSGDKLIFYIYESSMANDERSEPFFDNRCKPILEHFLEITEDIEYDDSYYSADGRIKFNKTESSGFKRFSLKFNSPEIPAFQ